METIARISRVARVFHALWGILLVALPVLTVAYWVSLNHVQWMFDPPPGLDAAHRPLPGSALWGGFAASLLPLAVVTYGLVQLRRLFGLYRRGRIFTSDNVRCLKGFGVALILWPVVTPIYDALVSVALTFSNPPGQRLLAVGLQGTDVGLALIGGVLVVMSWVMREGCRLADDQAQIV